jgi:hypothetical protein
MEHLSPGLDVADELTQPIPLLERQAALAEILIRFYDNVAATFRMASDRIGLVLN